MQPLIKPTLVFLSWSDRLGYIHPRDLAGIATKAGESLQAVTDKIASLKLGNSAGNVSFEDFLKVRVPFRLTA